MQVLFDDFSEERNNDVELPMVAYHAVLYLTDSAGRENGYFVETFEEYCGIDYPPLVEDFNTEGGGNAVAVCSKNSKPVDKATRNADELRLFYSIQSKGKYIDGRWDKYTTKTLKADISDLKFGKISTKSYIGKALKPSSLSRMEIRSWSMTRIIQPPIKTIRVSARSRLL